LPAPVLGELTRHKTTSALGRVVALDRARARGAQDAILFDQDGSVLEASSSNVFAVLNGKLCTPPVSRPLFPGTARARTIAWTGAIEADFTSEELSRADEAFLTNAVIGANPLVELDGIAIPTGPCALDVIARARAWRAAQS
jgi:branched-chain amino acid aminotransferase